MRSTKRDAGRQARDAEAFELLEVLAQAVSERFAGDPSATSVLVSRLPQNGRWYASIVRYTGSYGEGKKVVCNGVADTLRDALAQLSHRWLQLPEALIVDQDPTPSSPNPLKRWLNSRSSRQA